MTRHVLTAEDLAQSRSTYRARLDARFWDRMDRSGGPDACWPWLGGRTRYGYGRFMRNRRSVGAHREALERTLGRTLEPGEVACHHCDNKPCCNPAHLYAGSAADNNRDALTRGRHRSGAPGFQKMTRPERAAIVAWREAGYPAREVAVAFRVTPATVQRITREYAR